MRYKWHHAQNKTLSDQKWEQNGGEEWNNEENGEGSPLYRQKWKNKSARTPGRARAIRSWAIDGGRAVWRRGKGWTKVMRANQSRWSPRGDQRCASFGGNGGGGPKITRVVRSRMDGRARAVGWCMERGVDGRVHLNDGAGGHGIYHWIIGIDVGWGIQHIIRKTNNTRV